MFALKSKMALLLLVLLVAVYAALPLLSGGHAKAAQIEPRKLTISSGVPSASGVSYTWVFTTVTSGFHLDGLKFQACTAPVGTCNAPAGLSFSSATYTSQSGFTDAASFAIDGTGANDCIASASVLCLNRTSSTNDTAGSKTLAVGGVTNPSSANTAFFVRITTYNASTYPSGGIQDTGTTASAAVQTLTANAAVAEILNFCIGSTLVDDATTTVGNDCTAVTGTSVNLGTLDPTSVNTTPVSSNCTESDCNMNGVAMLRTNASGGAAVSYDAIQQTGTNHKGTLRISGAVCNAGSVTTDQCINALGTTQTAITPGTEDFGMTVNDNCGSTSSYSCVATGAGHSNNLEPSTNYLGCTVSSNPSYGTCNGFAWDETGTAEQIASSTTVVDDEALILKFAATPSITTPFGAYSAQADFIAVPTY